MKKLIFLFLILYSCIYSQGWNNYVQTSIPYSFHYQGGIDQFTNKNGINILVNSGYPSENLKYYLINTSGAIIRSYTFENQEVLFSSIDGDNNNIYIIYLVANTIKARRSTNAGLSWISNRE